MRPALVNTSLKSHEPLARLVALVLGVAAGVWLSACGSSQKATVGEAPALGRSPSTVVPAADDRPLLVALGDSLTAGLGLDATEAYPAVLQARLDAAGLTLRVVNAGVSGDTSAGGVSRLDLALSGDVRVLIVALGGNDGLRALPVDALRANLSKILAQANAREIATILAGMEAPPNLGADYTRAFRATYASLAKDHGVTFVPFLLEGVAGVERLNQPDGIHPTAEGARAVADHLWPVVEPLVRKALARAPRRASDG